MSPLRSLPLFLLLSLAACDNGDGQPSKIADLKDKAKAEARELVDKAAEATSELRTLNERLKELLSGLAENNPAKSREAAGVMDGLLKNRSLSWYVDILATEETKGLTEARDLIKELLAKEDITDTEKKALLLVSATFDHKDKFKTLDVVVVIAALVIDKQYGPKSRNIFLGLQKRLRPDDPNAQNLGDFVDFARFWEDLNEWVVLAVNRPANSPLPPLPESFLKISPKPTPASAP